MHQPAIRPATESDLAALVRVEIGAGQLFHSVGMPAIAAAVPAIADLKEAVAAERVWVTTAGREVVGYVISEVVDQNAHVAQVSVAPDHARQGLGRSMVEHVESWGRVLGCPATTLTTFRDVPWNAPYYQRLGYRMLVEHEIGPGLARIMAHEASLPGIDPGLRCAMVKPNGR